MVDGADIAEQFEKHLNSPKQTWLLGAGVSFPSNIPLMGPLTDRVLELANAEAFAGDEEANAIIQYIRDDISEGANIEDFLTHLGDLISLAERARSGSVTIGANTVDKAKLVEIHVALLRLIADTVRWGYRPAKQGDGGNVIEAAKIGKRGESIVTVDEHSKFIQSVFRSGRAGLEFLRSPVEFFTTNYDTLLEDALALHQIEYQDGFTGGGVAFWALKNYDPRDATRALVTKLHGSIDWYRPEAPPSPTLRIRDGDSYPSNAGAVMIYPQATKYVDTQRDPFAELFQRFRQRLVNGTDQVLLICGYSFGDEHINAEIEIAMSAPKNQLTIIAFADEPNGNLPSTLQTWRSERPWSSQLYIASPKGLYHGGLGPVFPAPDGARSWWTFAGVTELFLNGLPADIQEAIQ